MVEWFASGPPHVYPHFELLLDPGLAHGHREPSRRERGVELSFLFLVGCHNPDQFVGVPARHLPTLLRASRNSSSTGRSPSGANAASASLASWAVRPSDSKASLTSASGPLPVVSKPAPTLSLSSRITRPATFLPTPGTSVRAATSPLATARRTASGVRSDSTASASFGPTPPTVTR